MEQAIEIVQHRRRAQSSGLQQPFGVGGIELHAHGEIVTVSATLAQHAALASPKGDEEQRTDCCEEELRIDVARFRCVEVFRCAPCDLLNRCAAAWPSA